MSQVEMPPQGLACCAAESAHPDLWKGLLLPVFVPCRLKFDGNQHVNLPRVLEDKSGHGNHGIFHSFEGG